MKPVETTIDLHNKIVEDFKNESDRGAALLVGSLVENYLAKLLKSHMVNDPEVDKLFDGFGPVADFGKRIECAYAFKIIPAEQRQALNFIKKLRNHFAHNPFDSSFDKPPVSDWCRSISVSSLLSNGRGNEFMSGIDNRTKLMITVSLLVSTWETIILNNKRAQAQQG